MSHRDETIRPKGFPLAVSRLVPMTGRPFRRGVSISLSFARVRRPSLGLGYLLTSWMLLGLVLAACGDAPVPSDTSSESVTATSPATTATAAETTTTAPAAATTTAAAASTTTAPAAATTTAAAASTTTAPAAATTTAPVTTTTTTTAPVTTTTAGAPTQERPEIEGLGVEASAQVWKTIDTVEEIRGLEFDTIPAITVLSPEEFSARVRMEVEAELEDVEVDEALFKLLGLLGPDADLAALYGELYGESVAGFYSSDDKEMVLPRSGEEFSALETLTLLHELVHALTDQHFDFGPRLDDLVDRQAYDSATGLVALVEGDATLSEVLYVQNLGSQERARLFAEFEAFESPDIDIPLFMEQALYFPYDRGYEYVLNGWTEAGGWSIINDLYLDPPVSTEEIYEGARSDTTDPIEMEKPAGALPGGYEEIYDYTWGFLDILLMFEQILGPQAAVDAATGWGGGRSLVGYAPGGDVVFIWEYAGDRPGETVELAALLLDYASAGMDVGEPESQGESSFVGSGGDYVFVGPTPQGLVMVACSDPGVCPSVASAYRR